MNIVTRPTPEVELDADKSEAKGGPISAEERAHRQAAVDYACGSVRLEGFVVPPLARELYDRYINGEMTRKELGAKILAHYNS